MLAISQIEDALGSTLKGILAKCHNEDWDPTSDKSIDRTLYQKYASELYGIVVAPTVGEVKSVVKSISDSEGYPDGFKSLSL